MGGNLTIKLHDKQFNPFISEKEIQDSIVKMATHLNSDYSGKCPLFLSVLNGSFMFTSDLLKKVTFDCDLSFIKVSSYAGTSSTGNVSQLIGLNEDVSGRDLIILEDIVDTGNTIVKLMELLTPLNPASIQTAAFLFKPEAYKKEIGIKYIGMEVANDFLVGYGLDYNGRGRNLPEIYKLKED